MPTYGYRCTDCKHEFSVFQAMKDDPISICPECSGAVKRLLYPVGVVFKGSGWYITDSRKAEAKDKSSVDDTGTKAESSDTTTKEETTTKSDKESTAAPAADTGTAKTE